MADEIANGSDNAGIPMKDFAISSDVYKKLDIETGAKIARSIWGKTTGMTGYYFLRNQRYFKNRRIANGKMDMNAFVDRMEMNGKTNYANINWSAIKLANTAIGRLVGKWMRRKEKIVVTAVDLRSKVEKQEAADQAEFVMDNKDMLDELENASGVPMVPQDQFIANDKDELDEWVAEFNRLPEEIKYEMLTNNILAANGLFTTTKDKMLHDSSECGLVGTYTEMLPSGEIKVKWIRPENIIYSYSDYDDFRDTSVRGHMESMKIGELKKYLIENGGILTKDDFFDVVKTASAFQFLDKISYWYQNFNAYLYQPYDDWNVDVLFFEIKSVDCDDYVVTKTKKNNSTLVKRADLEKRKDNQEVIRDEKWNIYKGIYACKADRMLQWGLKENMIIPQDPKESGDVEFSYSFFMYQNYQMSNVAIPEKIDEPLEQMILARLKIQILVAKMIPAGAAVDSDALQELDLGLAGGPTKPAEAERIWRQTGTLYYRGRDAEGRPIPVPIKELANSGFIGQMQALIELYRFHYQVLKDELGNDPNLSQQAAQPRVTEGNVQTAVQESDDATDYMYNAYLSCMEETARKVCCLLNISVKNQAKQYRALMKEEEIQGRVFSSRIEMLPTEIEQQRIDIMMNNMIAANPELTNFMDVFKISRISKENTKLAGLYIRNCQKKYLKWQQETATKNSKENAEAQQASLQEKAQADSMLMDKEQNNEERNILLKGALDIMAKAVPISPETQVVFDAILQNVAMPLMAENAEIQQSLAQAEMQQQQSAQQEQMAAQEGQPMPQQEQQMQPQV